MRLWIVVSALWSLLSLSVMVMLWPCNGDLEYMFWGLFFWIAPPAFVLFLGRALNWVYRGFTDSN